ncbi:hypothetical protein EYS14_17760 [Alteromonadaceae bacterium M269]|nr:hypothetical protein EYS14_17760 [Alteromonadaceae bacterium M269]
MAKEKIAILGSGVAAMTSACYLTEQDNWQDKYDITVYQMGWRLGGKGASGRNAEYGQRIEEHGLHVWFGAYVNSFKTLEKVYADLDRPAGDPLATFDEAFKPHDYIVLQEKIKNEWKSWGIEFPRIPGNPADGSLDISFWGLLRLIYYWIIEFTKQLRSHSAAANADTSHEDETWFQHIVHTVKHDVDKVKSDAQLFTSLVHEFMQTAESADDAEHEKHHRALHSWINWLKKWLDKEFIHLLDGNDELRRLYISADLAITCTKGMLEDKVYSRGFGYLNQWDLMEWLTINGANTTFTVDSAPIRGFYDLVFGYENGDYQKPNLEAGVALLAMSRIALCYHGGVMWKMQAGMGDTIFSPIYQLLERRGVKFEYFHKVDELKCDDGQVTEIKLTQQVALKSKAYQPFVYVKGLPCWPSQPLLDQVDNEQAALIKKHDINLESFWTDWPSVYEEHFKKPLPQVTLEVGQQFDKVIFGISVASLPHLCPQLLENDEKLKKCSEELKAVATQAFQVWTDVGFDQLGWETPSSNGEEPILSAFVEPYDTWAAMNQLLCREDWQDGLDPKNVAYFCSVQPIADYPSKEHHDFPKETTAVAKSNAQNFLKHDVHWLWTKLATADSFQWETLTDPENQQGIARFDSQYWRSNVDPSERYVMSVKNSSQYRLDTNATAFNNLYITGDWINTGVNAGCVEAAVMAGMSTSRAICGYPESINGENGFAPFKKSH